MAVIKYAALFEGRHLYPSYVKDSIFNIQEGGYEPLGIYEFESKAYKKLLIWKNDGVDTLYLYLSGLTSACVSVLNAASLCDMDVKLYHYSCLLGAWLPQFTNLSKQTKTYSSGEQELWKRELAARKSFSKQEKENIVKYMLTYNDLELKYGKCSKLEKANLNWGEIKRTIMSRHRNVDNEYLDMMRIYICPEILEKKPKYSFHSLLIRTILRQRKDGEINGKHGYREKHRDSNSKPSKK